MSAEQSDWERRVRHVDDQLALGEIAIEEWRIRHAALLAERPAPRILQGALVVGFLVGMIVRVLILLLVFVGGFGVLIIFGAPGWTYPVWAVGFCVWLFLRWILPALRPRS